MVASAAADGEGPARSPMAVAVMLSGSIMMALIFTVLSPVLPQIADHYAHSDGVTVAQLIMSAPGIGVIVGGLTGGILVDRFGRKRLLLIGLALFALAGCAPLYVDGAWPLLATRALLGWSGATIQASVIGMIATTFSGPQRAKMIGYEAAIGSAAAVGSLLASGMIAEAFGWRAPASLYLFALVVLIPALFAIPADGRRAAPASATAVTTGFGAFARRLAPFLAVIPFVYASNFMLSIQMPFLLAENGVVGPAAKSQLMVFAVASGVLGAASSGWIRQGVGEWRSFALCLALMGVGHTTLGLSHDTAMTITGGTIAGLGGGMLLPNLMAIATTRASDALRSRAAGLVYSMAYVGEFLNPVALRPLSGAIGIHDTFRTVGALLLALALAVAAFGAARTARDKSRNREERV